MAQRNLLCCKLADVNIAVVLERVIGVVEGGIVTPLPYTAPAFEGLVEAIGQVMPQVDLAATLSLRSIEGGILVVVSDRGGSLALRVPQVIAMIQVEGEDLAASAGRARERHPLYMAEIEHQDELYNVLDLDLLATSEALDLSAPDGGVMLAEANVPAGPAVAADASQIPFLLLEVAGERYAMRNSAIVELNMPAAVRRMPGAPDWVLGLIDLRGVPLVGVSTAVLLGRPGNAAPEVCLIAELNDGMRVALFVDRALGLERVSPSLIYTMTQSMTGIGSYIVLGDDDVVAIIEPRDLLAQPEQVLRELVPSLPPAPEDAALASNAGQYQQLLTMRLGRELFGMTLERIVRIQASVHLTPLPSHIAYFDGMAGVGDAIVPVIDLRRQHGAALTAFDTSQQPPCILTLLEGAMTGILVDQVLSILDIPLDRFEPVKETSHLPISHIVSFEGRLISVLTIDRLLPTL